MADDRNPVDVATDLLVFAPIGLALAVKEALPTIVSRGRAEVGTQVDLARMVGTLVARQGHEGLGRALGGAREQFGGVVEQVVRGWLSGPGPAPTPSDPSDDAPRPVPDPVAEPAPESAPAPIRSPRPAPARSRTRPEAPVSAGLALPDYDSLAASQVVSRLAGLTPGELEAVRAYEASGRARRTILGRIAQLQG